jgi:hypothetical protein
MASGRYQSQPPVPAGPAFNPYAYNPQLHYPTGNTPGGAGTGWGQGFEQGQAQVPYGMGSGMGLGMGMGMAMGYGMNAQNQANLSGFGLTMPATPTINAPYNATPGPSAPAASAPNSAASASGSRDRTQPQSQSQAQTQADKSAAGGKEEETEKSKRLKEAVASLTVGDRRALEGTPLTPDEMAERFRVQEKLMSSLPEGDQNNRMLEAMQVSFCLRKRQGLR